MSQLEELETQFERLVANLHLEGLDKEFSALRIVPIDHVILCAYNFRPELYVGNRVGGVLPEVPNKLWVRRFDVEFSKWVYNGQGVRPGIFRIGEDISTELYRSRMNMEYHRTNCLTWAIGYIEIHKPKDYNLVTSVDDIKRVTNPENFREEYIITVKKRGSYKSDQIKVDWDSHGNNIDGLYDIYEQERQLYIHLSEQQSIIDKSLSLDKIPIMELFEIAKRTNTIRKFFIDVWFYTVGREELIGF